MRVLHVGSGFRPWRRGGLIAYVEDLMWAQVRHGHDVTYFFSGRHYPFLRGPRLRRHGAKRITMLEVINSPLHDHGRQPDLEIGEPRIERMLERAIDEAAPDVVHVQELAGIPSSVIDVADRLGIPTVVTLQDYFALCPAFKLVDHSGNLCLRDEVGADCVATTAAEARAPGTLIEATLLFHLAKARLAPKVDPRRRESPGHRAAAALARHAVRGYEPSRDPVAFQRRREVNVERLNRATRVIAMSGRVAELHATLGVTTPRMRTLQLTLAHIERLRPREATGEGPVVFATLGALESVAKGGRLLLDAVRSLEATAPRGFKVLVFGWIDPAFRAEAASIDAIELRGPYYAPDLDRLLDEVDVGLMPSVWEEAYGFAGVEFLAKGIPVVANDVGGMPEYTREGETGWLNRSCSAAELAEIMRGIVARPGQVAELNAAILAARDSIVMPIDRHAEELDAVYAEAVAER